MSLTPRKMRQMMRESIRLVEDVCDAHKGPNDTRDDYIKSLEARCELQEQALKESKNLINFYENWGGRARAGPSGLD